MAGPYGNPVSYGQVGTWTPYLGKADKRPDDPRPVGRMPQPGVNSPRFPTVGPTEIQPPAGGYQSTISTRAPIDPSRMSAVTSVFSGLMPTGNSSGDQSRRALSRAVSDISSNALGRSADQFNQQYRQQAEKSRSEDILAQRQNASDRFQMDVFKAIFGEDTNTRYSEGIKDLRQYWTTERHNENAKQTAMWMSFIGGLL